MSIFKRGEREVQTSASPESGANGGEAAQAAMMPPGVVPPATTPIYSMRVPETSPRGESNDRGAAAEVAAGVRVAMQRTRAATPPAGRLVQQASGRTQRAMPQYHQPFDPVRATQAALLSLAWNWAQSGAPIRAIHTYVELLKRYPDTAAADAAVADLAELSAKLVEEGQFHTALAIYDHLEELL